jgi:D-methionine transport system substrate-binding protein
VLPTHLRQPPSGVCNAAINNQILTLGRCAGTLLLAVSTLAVAGPNGIRWGVVHAQIESLQIAVKEAKAQGLNVELVEFSDWNTPNAALANGDIDVNYFSTSRFWKTPRSRRLRLRADCPRHHHENRPVFTQWKSFAQIPTGGKVAIAGDPVNGGRGLLLLEKAGLIKLKPAWSYKATIRDIVANPRKLQIVQLEASQLARSLDDVDLAQGYRPSSSWRATTGQCLAV